MTQPSLSTSSNYLYLRHPKSLEEITSPNLNKKLNTLVKPAEEMIITDPNLPISLKLVVNFVGPEDEPNDIKSVLS